MAFTQLYFDVAKNGYVGVAKGSGSGAAYDVLVKYINGQLVAIVSKLGSLKWDKDAGDYAASDEKRVIILEKQGGVSKSGSKMPAYSGYLGELSFAYWESHKFDGNRNMLDDIDYTKIAVILGDVDEAAVAAAESFHNASCEDERVEQASTFHAQADMNGDCNRPDESDEALAEMVAYSQALNG